MTRREAWKIGVVGLATALLGVRTTRADLMPSYPLNTLSFMASDVIQGTIVGPYDDVKNRWEAGAVVRVEAVYAGALRPGAEIKVAGLLNYKKFPDRASSGKETALEKGDRVWLFLETPWMARGVPEEGRPPQDRAADTGKWVPVMSGVRLEAGGRVMAPQQESNPGPYGFTLPADNKSPVVEAFSGIVDQAVDEAAGIRARLAKPVESENQSWALRMLKVRQSTDLGLWDPLVHALLLRLGQTCDLSLAQEVVEDPRIPMAESNFAFASPEGRELLLKKLADSKLPAEVKVRYLEAVRATGPLYGTVARMEYRQGTGVWTWEGKDVPGNGRYLQRLADVVKSGHLQELTEKVPGWTLSVENGDAVKFPEAAQDDAKAQEIMAASN